MTDVRDLADRFHQRWLEHNPFAASSYGIPGYDDLVPDESEAGEHAWRAEIDGYLAEAATIDRNTLSREDAVTLDCTIEAATQEQESIDSAQLEYTVTAKNYAGPAMLFAIAARTVLLDDAAADDYLARLRRSGTWLDRRYSCSVG